ncbi:MAG: hypothetical protein P8P74_10390 [Crocinitomicaceae bacterium]|nr:hypothetical protein [Crocinitomicaceae bacterium]
MRFTRFLFIATPLLILGFVIASSCEKKVIGLTPSPVNDIPENSFSAYIGPDEFKDTVLWSQEDAGILTISAFANGENGYPRVTLKFPSDITGGTFGLGGPQSVNQAFLELGPLPDQKYVAIDSTGIFAITTHFTESNLIRGKFFFTAEVTSTNPGIPNVDVWSGNFLITY